MNILPLLILLAAGAAAHAGNPVVSNIRASQRPGTKTVDIVYDLAAPDDALLAVTVGVSTNGGTSYFTPVASLGGAVGGNVGPGLGKRVSWNAGTDLPAGLFSNLRVQVTACDQEAPAPPGMALILAGSFTMGDPFNEGDRDELPTHVVRVSALYMDRYEVSKALWDEIYNWAVTHGYNFEYGAQGKAANHPAHSMTWYDAVKWCNARSEKEGRMPAYYTNAAQTAVYRTGQVTVQNDWVKWTAGYRLPTEAEWEKAARGGSDGHRFPWSNTDTISHSQANYDDSPADADPSVPSQGYHPAYNDGVFPYTSPVASFEANPCGLYDMAGNVAEWCWDWYASAYYSSSPGSDPRGPISGSIRVFRGGSWKDRGSHCRSSFRDYFSQEIRNNGLGFRAVLAAGQP